MSRPAGDARRHCCYSVFILTLVMAIPLGVVMALARLSSFTPLNLLMQFYIWVFRGTPLLLQLFFIYYGLGIIGLKLDRFTAAVLSFVLNYSAYLAEIYRSGIQSIDKGQLSGRYIGLSRPNDDKGYSPQVVKRVLPPITNESSIDQRYSPVYAIRIVAR